jgi:hypothetical protein
VIFEILQASYFFFCIIQHIYTLFAKSTKRWKIFVDHVPGLTVKSWSNTRWESRIKSVQAIRFQTPQTTSALIALEKASTDDPIAVSECQSLVSALENFEFLVGLVIWHDILFSINKVSKKLQSKIVSSMLLSNTLKVSYHILRSIEMNVSLLVWIQQKNIASELDIESIFPTKHQRKRKNILMNKMKTTKYNTLLWTPLEESTSWL